MATNPKLNYSKRNFKDIRDELINYVKLYYPEVYSDFNDSNIGMMLLELNAALGDLLSTRVDSMFQETQLDNAQQRKSLLAIAKTLGFNIPNKRASVAVCEFTVTVPPKGDTFDESYLPILKSGTQVTGGGKVFELIDELDFLNPFSNSGLPNRTIIPNLNSNEQVQSYDIKKSEIVYNGITRVEKRVLTANDIKPFMEITLPTNDVLSIEQIIIKAGTNYTTEPTLDEFFDEDLRWYEVDYLAQPRIFTTDNSLSVRGEVKAAKYKNISKKFIKEFTDNGFCKITFGGGEGDKSFFDESMEGAGFADTLAQYLNNTSLGETPPINSTMYIRYRVGGGANSNIGLGVLNNLGNVNFFVSGARNDINQEVRRSLKSINVTPALGGADRLSIEQIRRLITYNYSGQNRCVTLNDYLVQVYKMPGKYGIPFKLNVYKLDNKIMIPILGIDENNKLTNENNNLLKQNIASYLSDYRMINDYVEIEDGQVLNLAFDFELYITDNVEPSNVALSSILKIQDYFNIANRSMDEDIYMGNLIEEINNVPGVTNVISYKIYNKVGGDYSLNEIQMEYENNTTREIKLVDNTVFAEKSAMFEIKYPEKDIRIICKKRSQL
jgi:hypothetical protein